MKEQNNGSEFTIGLDLGERRHRFCALNGKGEVVEEGTLGNDRASLARLTARYRWTLAVMEAGAHSPWISRSLEGLGWEVIVSNPRKVRAIYQHEGKSDRRDALMLGADRRMDRARSCIPFATRVRKRNRICCASNCVTVWCVRAWP